MLNFLNCNYRKSLFSFALVPFIVTSGGIKDVIYNVSTNRDGQIVAQNTFAGWVASFWQRRPKRSIARSISGICPIAPGLVETYFVFRARPLFLWKNPGNNQEVKLIVRDYDNQSVVWEQPVKTADEKILYNNQQPLESGKLYQWKLSDSTNWTTFQVMSASDRAKIQADLLSLEQKLRVARASDEEIALRKSDYFRNYQVKHKTEDKFAHLWSDSLQSMFEVEQPSADFVKNREAYVASLCKSEASTAKKSNK